MMNAYTLLSDGGTSTFEHTHNYDESELSPNEAKRIRDAVVAGMSIIDVGGVVIGVYPDGKPKFLADYRDRM